MTSPTTDEFRASTLARTAWWIFAIDVLLGAVLIIAAVLESGDAAARGLAQVYAVGCVIALAIFGAILALSTWLRSCVGLWLSIVIMVAPVALFIAGLLRQ